jgi:hypothetical protein
MGRKRPFVTREARAWAKKLVRTLGAKAVLQVALDEAGFDRDMAVFFKQVDALFAKKKTPHDRLKTALLAAQIVHIIAMRWCESDDDAGLISGRFAELGKMDGIPTPFQLKRRKREILLKEAETKGRSIRGLAREIANNKSLAQEYGLAADSNPEVIERRLRALRRERRELDKDI